MASQTPGRRSKEFSVEIDQAQLTKLFNELEQKVSVKNLASIVRNEAAAILFTAARRTRLGSKDKIISHSGTEKYSDINYVTNASPQFKKILRQRKIRLAEKLRRVGLAKDAWLYIARQLNLKPTSSNQTRGLKKLMSNPPTVRKSKAIHRATGGREVGGAKGQFSIHVYYGNPVGRWTGASPALRSAIYGRRAYFRRNLKEGVFYSAREIAAKYPGLEITKK